MLNTKMFKAGILAAGTILAFCSQALAAHSGSPEDQLACTPDVYRLCSSYVPDEEAIVACLNRNVQALSPACHTVMTRPSTPPKGSGEDEDTD